jgi:L-seryl-tRNA(Ser) seleniumtransferase
MDQPTPKTNEGDDPRRLLPSVWVLLLEPRIKTLIEEYSRPVVIDVINSVMAGYRQALGPNDMAPDINAAMDEIQESLAEIGRDRLRRVVNATGIILHTGLGRAVLSPRAVGALAGLDQCCNLQIDLETGERGKRNYMTEKLLTKLTGAEAALIVNNNAAATMLILTVLCKRKEVIVSRGQLIEIGGSFRLPDCIEQSGATMVEVGTTNKTHLRDYEKALTENTGALLRVNPSNYKIIGFIKDVPVAELVILKQKQPVIVIDDLGCGALVDMKQYGLTDEPTVPESVAAGADVVCFSGDKLIGGPQAGIIVGKKKYIDLIKKDPLTRMLRVGKLTDMALEHSLRLFLEPDRLLENHPTLKMVTTPLEVLREKATQLKHQLDEERIPLDVRVTEGESAMGGGSMPGAPIPTYLLAVRSTGCSPDRLAYLLRDHEPPVIARIKEDEVLLDMRTLLDGEERTVLEALRQSAARAQSAC